MSIRLKSSLVLLLIFTLLLTSLKFGSFDVHASQFFKFDFTGADNTLVNQYDSRLKEYHWIDAQAYLFDNQLKPLFPDSEIAVDSFFNTVDQCASVDVLFPTNHFELNVRGDSATEDIGYILDITNISGSNYNFKLYDNTEYSNYSNNQNKIETISDGYHNIQTCAIGNGPAIITSYVDYIQDQNLTTIPYSGEFFNEGLVGEPSFIFTNLVDNFIFSDSFIPPSLTALNPTQVWIGLKNSDDVGLKFDLVAEAYKDNTLITSGELDSVSGGSNGFNNAHLYSIPFNSFLPLDFPSGSVLGLKLYVRNACSGSAHNSGTARLWFNDSSANSRFGSTIGTNSTYDYLLDNFVLGTGPGPAPKKTIDIAAGARCSTFKPFGTWTITP